MNLWLSRDTDYSRDNIKLWNKEPSPDKNGDFLQVDQDEGTRILIHWCSPTFHTEVGQMIFNDFQEGYLDLGEVAKISVECEGVWSFEI